MAVFLITYLMAFASYWLMILVIELYAKINTDRMILIVSGMLAMINAGIRAYNYESHPKIVIIIQVIVLIGSLVAYSEAKAANRGQSSSYSRPKTTQLNTTPTSAPPRPFTGIGYHGTKKLDVALEIFFTRRWFFKDHNPFGLYVSTSYDDAAHYAGQNGYVVKVYFAPGVHLIHTRLTYYVAPIKKNEVSSVRYEIDGIWPIAIYENRTRQRIQ